MPEVVEEEAQPDLVSEKQNQADIGDENTVPTTQDSKISGVISTTSPTVKKFK